MAEPIRFYFDVISPYAYLAFRALPAIAARHGRAIELEPILFAALLDHHGQKGPAEIPAKRAYLMKDVVRKAHALSVSPVAPPPSHPFSPLLALRAILAVEGEARRKAAEALFSAVWGGGPGVETPAVVEARLTEAGLDGAAIVERTKDAGLKARLRDGTARAIEAGVFGVPTMLVDGELFFGVDSLPFLEQFLEGRDPVSAEDVARWATLPASASRI